MFRTVHVFCPYAYGLSHMRIPVWENCTCMGCPICVQVANYTHGNLDMHLGKPYAYGQDLYCSLFTYSPVNIAPDQLMWHLLQLLPYVPSPDLAVASFYRCMVVLRLPAVVYLFCGSCGCCFRSPSGH